MPKQNYSMYCSFAQRIYKTYKGLNFFSPKDKEGTTLWDKSIRVGIQSVPNFMSTTDFHILVQEKMWKENGSPSVFIQDKKLVEMIYNAKFDILPESIVSPKNNEMFSFVFPNNFSLSGFPITSCLFGEMTISDYHNYLKKIGESEIHKEISVIPDENCPDVNEKGIFLICQNHCSTEGSHLRTWFPKSVIANIFEDGWMESHLHNDAWLVDKEYKQQRVYLRICAGICIYLSAFQNCIKKGLPENASFLNSKPGKKNDTVSIDSSIHASPSAHWRTWHFRTLRHEKYHRNPDGTPRVVFVRDTLVGVEKEKITV